MSFSSPLFLLALLVVPVVLVLALVVDRRRSRYPLAFTNLDLLAGLVKERRSLRRWVPLALLLLALACAATALGRPKARLSVPQNNSTVIFLVDVSGSMRANDVEPTRLDAAVSRDAHVSRQAPAEVQGGPCCVQLGAGGARARRRATASSSVTRSAT